MSKILSDYNKNETIPTTVAKNKLYSDLSLSFEINPITKDISPLTDIDAIKNSVKNLIFTNFYERPFNPTLGSGLRSLLFEPASIFTEIEIQNAIENVINTYEPRVNQIKVSVQDESDRNSYQISIQFTVAFLTQVAEVSFFLTRLR